MDKITFEEWKKVEMRVGKVLKVERIVNTDKLYKLQVDIGIQEPIQIVTGLVPYYSDVELLDKKIIVLVNLEPAKFKGEISQGMLLCAKKTPSENTGDISGVDKCVLLTVDQDIEPGALIT